MDMTAERTERPVNPTDETPARTGEGQPRSPFRRRLLRAAVGVLAAESLVGGALWGKDQFDRFFARPTTVNQGEIPKPPAIEPDKPPSEKAINKVPLAEITKQKGKMVMDVFGGETTEKKPYAFALTFENLTIVAVKTVEDQQTGEENSWIALAMPGENISRESLRRTVTNFDGTITERYIYKGFTPWFFINRSITVYPNGLDKPAVVGRSDLLPRLQVGETISIKLSINQNNMNYQEMNKDSFDLLEKNLGKPNVDRSDQTFKFRADFAIF